MKIVSIKARNKEDKKKARIIEEKINFDIKKQIELFNTKYDLKIDLSNTVPMTKREKKDFEKSLKYYSKI